MHKRLILLLGAIFIVLIISVFILDFKKIAFGDNFKRFSQVVYRKVFYTFLYHKRKQSVSLSSANYIGSCSVCNCLYELPAHQACLIRQGQRLFCVCPDCQEKQARGGL